MSSEALSARRPATAAPSLDRNALRVNQASIILFLALGFLIDQPWLVAFVCAVMAIGTVFPKAALFQRVHRDLLRPAGLPFVVIALAAVNLIFGFCAGCFVYFQLQQLGVTG